MALVVGLGGAGQGLTEITGLLQGVCVIAMTPHINIFVQDEILGLMKTALDVMADIRETEPSLPFSRVSFISLGMVFKIP